MANHPSDDSGQTGQGSSPGGEVQSPTLPLPPPRDGHSLAEAVRSVLDVHSDPQRPRPLSLEHQRRLPVVAAREPLDRSFQSRAARTLWLPSDLKDAPAMRRSSLAAGAWELPAAPIDWGLPGRSLETWTPAQIKAEAKYERHCAGYAPRSATLSAQARPTATRRPRVVRAADGRRYKLSADDPHVQIFGWDDRFEIYPDNYPAQCVCHLTMWTQRTPTSPWDKQGEGTGFLAGRRVCVTASHLWPGGEFSGWKIDVVPADFQVGVSLLGFSAHTNAHSARRASTDVGTDIMVLGLYDAIGDIAGYFGTTGYTDAWEDWNVWSLVGYPYDHPGIPTAQTGIAVYDDDNGPDTQFPDGSVFSSLQLESYADEASGMSGGPLFSWFEDGFPYAVGVHKGREVFDAGPFGVDRNSVASGGALLNGMVRWARGAWD